VLALATLLPAVRSAVYAALRALVPMEKMPLDMRRCFLDPYFGNPARFFNPCLGDRTVLVFVRFGVRRALASSLRVASSGASSVMNLA